jgi:hypothetical protein
MEHRDELVDMTLAAGHETMEGVKPSKEPFDLATSPHPTQATAVLGDDATPAPMGSDHLDAVGHYQGFVERIAVVAAIAAIFDEALQQHFQASRLLPELEATMTGLDRAG